MARLRASEEEQVGHAEKPIAERRRKQIADTAVVLFSERGYFQTTIEDISNEIGVGKGLIYRYFKDKNDVLFSALCAVLEKYKRENIIELLETMGPLAALKRILSINCLLAEEHALEILLAYRSTKDLMPEQRRQIKVIESEIVGEVRQCLEACIQNGSMHSINPRIMAYQYLMYGHTWALKNWALSPDFTVAEFIAEGERLLILPYLTPAGRRKLEAISNPGADKTNRSQR